MKGFTVTEMMVTSAIFIILFLALFAVLTTGNNIFQRDVIHLQLRQNVRNGMDRIVREIRESKSSTVTTVDADKDRISFNTPNETGIQYYINNGQLVREYPSGTLKVVAIDMTRLKFTKNNKFMTIDLSASRTYMGTVFSFPLIEYVRLRNE